MKTLEPKSVNFSSGRMDVVKKVDELYHKKVMKKLRLKGTYQTSVSVDRVLDMLKLVEANYEVLGIPFSEIVFTEYNLVRSKFPVDFNSVGFYSKELDTMYIYPKKLTPLHKIGVIIAHEYAHLADHKLKVTNYAFDRKLSKYLESIGTTRANILKTSEAYAGTELNKEIFATSYHQLFADELTDVADNVLKIAESSSSLTINRSALKQSSFIDKLFFQTNLTLEA
jgi:hypothetical protein